MKRRRLILRTLSGTVLTSIAATSLPLCAFAQAAAGTGSAAGKLSETDPQAVALGYKDDTTRVDEKKFPNHQATQICAGCQFYQGTAKDALAPCQIFAGKQVAAKGWCSSYVKKAAG